MCVSQKLGFANTYIGYTNTRTHFFSRWQGPNIERVYKYSFTINIYEPKIKKKEMRHTNGWIINLTCGHSFAYTLITILLCRPKKRVKNLRAFEKNQCVLRQKQKLPVQKLKNKKIRGFNYLNHTDKHIEILLYYICIQNHTSCNSRR